MKTETLKNRLSLATAWLRDPDSSSLAQCGEEALKSFTVRFIVSVLTIKRAVIVLGLFYLCLFILFHCLYKSQSHFVLLWFCPFQLLTDERGRKSRLANKLGREGVWKLNFHGDLLLHLGGMKAPQFFFLYFYGAFTSYRYTRLLLLTWSSCTAISLTAWLQVLYWSWKSRQRYGQCARYRWGKQKSEVVFRLAFGGK